MVRADVAAGVTGSLVAALALSYAIFPGTVVPRSWFADEGRGAATGRIPGAVVVAPAATVEDPLRARAGAVARLVAPAAGRGSLVRAERTARQRLADTLAPDDRKRPDVADPEVAGFLTSGLLLVRASVTRPRQDRFEQASAEVAGRTVEVSVGSGSTHGRTRTAVLVESDGGRGRTALRSTETLDGVPCPDATGAVDFTVRTEVRVDAPDSKPVTTVAAARVTAEVDERAEVRTARAELSTSAEPDGSTPTAEVALDPGGRMGEIVAAPGEEPAVGSATTEGLTAARALALGSLAAAAERWRSGGCVELAASLPAEVAEGSTTPLTPEVVAMMDGEPVESAVSVDLRGPGQVRETDEGLFFVAGPEPGRVSTLVLRTVSVRGVAEATVEVSTPSPDLRVEGGYKSVQVRGVKCGGPQGRWELDLVDAGGSSVGALVLRLDEQLRGTFSGSRRFASPAGTVTVSERGTVRFLEEREVLRLTDQEGETVEVPVTSGGFC